MQIFNLHLQSKIEFEKLYGYPPLECEWDGQSYKTNPYDSEDALKYSNKFKYFQAGFLSCFNWYF